MHRVYLVYFKLSCAATVGSRQSEYFIWLNRKVCNDTTFQSSYVGAGGKPEARLSKMKKTRYNKPIQNVIINIKE